MTDQEPKGLARGLTHYGDPDFAVYLRRSFAKSMGYSDAMLERPVVGIAYTPSGFNNCHRHFPELLEAVKRGVLASGGLPLEFPTISLGEVFLNPTSLKFRNLMAMDTEEMIRAQPMDAVVLMGGCDKTVPAQLMGAISAGRPAIQLVAGPMMTSRHAGERLGACTDCRRFWARYRAGDLTAGEIAAVEGKLATTAGTCAVMGTASTMACIAETLGMSLPGTAAIPAVHADRLRAAEATGAAAVGLTSRPILPSEIVTAASVENALRVLLALGGSTNAIIHLTAIAGRNGIEVRLDRLNELSETTPVLVDLKPVGQNYMEDFFAAGGVGAVLRELKPLLDLDCMTVAGRTLGERLAQDTGDVDRNVTARCSSARGGRWSSPRSTICRAASTIPTSTSPRTISWCCRTPARKARPACPRPAICRYRRSCPRAASRTWSGSPMPGCREPPTAPSCCTSRPNPRSAARSGWCGTAIGSGCRCPGTGSILWSTRKSSPGAATNSRRPIVTARRRAAMKSSMAKRCCRRTKAATSRS
jgi:hypothetical protein